MIENLILQFGALGIVAYVVYFQMNNTNATMKRLASVIEKNSHVIEFCMRNKGDK